MSKVFTGYDAWVSPSGEGLCPACTWLYRTPTLRTDLRHLTRTPPAPTTDGVVTTTHVRRLLRRALPVDAAVVVPLRPGRKHLLAHASWGQMCLDDLTITWSAADAHRLHLLLQLRHDGFTAADCRAPTPPYRRLQHLPAGRRNTVLRQWEDLAPWRARRPWLDLALHLSRTPNTPPSQQPHEPAAQDREDRT